MVHQREYLRGDERGVPVVDRAVFGVAVLACVRTKQTRKDTGVDEDSDHGWYLACVHHVVQHDASADFAIGVQVRPSVLEHDER